MRILKLHFKNLNSLVGEWIIDFTVSEYSEQGIFAITGPTGAGKSTILDAICLALYGRTPRLERINASQNEIMSRQSGECFTSLEFQTATGSYRTLWSQARARKKPEGNLQNAQHIIEDKSTDKILEDKLSKTSQVVTEVTGMDFEHFTRAMLLAQGSFAKFLQSSADERSPVLEKITGTEIYSQISKLVHERKTSEENILDNINAQLSGIRLLTSQEIESLQIELTQLTIEISELLNNKSMFEKQQAWLSNLKKLREELTTISEARQQLQLAQEQFSSDELRLKDAKIADEINSDIYINLLVIRKQVTEVMQNLITNQQQLPQIQDELAKQETNYNQASNELNRYKDNHILNLKTLQQVRLLDADILTKTNAFAGLTAKLDNCNAELNILTEQRQNVITQQNHQQLLYTEISSYLVEHQAEAQLVTAYSGICAELDNLLGMDKKISRYQTEQSIEHFNQHKLTKQILELDTNKTKYAVANEELTTQINQFQQNIQELASGESIAILKDKILHLNIKQTDYLELAKQLLEEASLEIILRQFQADLGNEQKALVETKPLVFRETELSDYTHQLIESLTAQKILQSKIISLSEERNNLQPSQPCPLCGALDHPYAHDGVLLNNELDNQIAQAKAGLGVLLANITHLNAQLATNLANIDKLSEQQNDVVSRRDSLQQSISNLLGKYSLSKVHINHDLIQHELTQINLQINKLNEQIKQLHEYEYQLTEYQKKQQGLEKMLIEINLSLTKLNEQKLAHEKHLDELAGYISTTQSEYQLLLNRLINELTIYQIQSINSAEIPAIKDTLAERLNIWQTKQQQAEIIKVDLQKLGHLLEQNSSLQVSINKQITEYKIDLTIQQNDLNEVRANRTVLFGDQNTDQREKLWQQELQTIEQKTKAAEAKLNQLIRQQTSLLAVIDKDIAQFQPLQERYEQLEEQFTTRLNTVNITNEAEFIGRLLSREEVAAIQQRADNLKQKATELSGRLKQTTETLVSEEAKQLTNRSSDKLQIEIDSTQTNYDSYNQRIGEIRGQLTSNQQALEQQQDTLRLRDKQLLITERYRRLHVLIGSSDGKKFRNFAQGLTFELVVKHANQQLRQIFDRYLLIRDNYVPLELNVIDNYQGGEIRSTKNLSGGECFVISLALALGLSKLSSNKVQINSLFLDEGFGTLDEDSLQTALDSLDGLQRDGKLIGVISHVGALKDRISLQMQVEPLSGGVSRISGVGCSKINKN